MSVLIYFTVGFAVFAGGTGLFLRSKSPRERRLKKAVLITSGCVLLFLLLWPVVGEWLGGGRVAGLVLLVMGMLLLIPLSISVKLFVGHRMQQSGGSGSY